MHNFMADFPPFAVSLCFNNHIIPNFNDIRGGHKTVKHYAYFNGYTICDVPNTFTELGFIFCISFKS